MDDGNQKTVRSGIALHVVAGAFMITVAGGFIVAGLGSPTDREEPADAAGLYSLICARCHGPRGEGIPPFKPLRGTARPIAEIVKQIRDGKGAMPPFGYLSEADQQALAEYVKGLGGR